VQGKRRKEARQRFITSFACCVAGAEGYGVVGAEYMVSFKMDLSGGEEEEVGWWMSMFLSDGGEGS
jgi:hypothetical protein